MSDVDPRLRIFVDLFNLTYPDWEIFGRSYRKLEPQLVDFGASLRSYHGRCGPRSDGRVYYRVNAEKWQTWEWPRRIKLVIHELAHVKQTDHSPDFWEQVVDNYWTLHDHSQDVEAIVDAQVDWEKVAEHLVNNPSNSMVDNRIETAYERQLKLADALEYPNEIPPFDAMRILITHQMNGNDDIAVSPDEVEYEKYSIKELAQHFRARPRPGINYHRDIYRVAPPKAVKKPGGGYRVIEGDKRAGIYKHAFIDRSGSREKMPIEVVDSVDGEQDAAVADD